MPTAGDHMTSSSRCGRWALPALGWAIPCLHFTPGETEAERECIERHGVKVTAEAGLHTCLQQQEPLLLPGLPASSLQHTHARKTSFEDLVLLAATLILGPLCTPARPPPAHLFRHHLQAHHTLPHSTRPASERARCHLGCWGSSMHPLWIC